MATPGSAQVDQQPDVKAAAPNAAHPPYWKGRRAALLAGAALFLAVGIGATSSKKGMPPELRPLEAPRLSRLAEFAGSYRDRTLWGTYRPGHYFGMRMKQPRGLQTGFMWSDPAQGATLLSGVRHQAQERDGLGKFGWERHDGEAFGRQELQDGRLRLTTSFAKRSCSGCRGGDWAVRITMEASKDSLEPSGDTTAPAALDDSDRPQEASMLFYIADEAGALRIDRGRLGGASLLAAGETWPLGGWQLAVVPKRARGQQAPKIRHLGLKTPHTHNLTDLIAARVAAPSHAGTLGGSRTLIRSLGEAGGAQLPDASDFGANAAVFQIHGPLPLSADFVFAGSLTPAKAMGSWLPRLIGPSEPAWPPSEPPAESLRDRIAALSGGALTRLLEDAEQRFDARFATTFDLEGGKGMPPGTTEASKAALSNMLGGVGYFYGRAAVKVSGQVVESEPSALLASVPSRSFFPRGFLWDEGFHQLLIRKWSPQLSREILASWLDQLNSEGWIAREQILGEEARSRVPSEFLVQDPTAANPPTLFLPLADMARRLRARGGGGGDDGVEAAFLRAAYPRLRAWVDWFVRTQRGELPGSWRWRGRHMERLVDPISGELTAFTRELNPKTLTSGLDDYPRASHPSNEERHVDLYCWMALAARSLATIGAALQLPSAQVAPYERLAARLADTTHLNELHYDASVGQYRDFGNHTEDVWLDWRNTQLPREWQNYPPAQTVTSLQGMQIPDNMRLRRVDMARYVGTPPKLGFVPHYGYVSLFPLLMRLLSPASPELAAQFGALRDGGIMGPFGLQSLSGGSSLYAQRNTEHDPPYWRGPVWININFLTLASLHHYAQAGGETASLARELHADLRSRLLDLLVGVYARTGFLWENYDERTGDGRGCRPFTGWTALLVLVASEEYFEV